MKQSWRMINTGVGAAASNMAADEALLEMQGEDAMPVLRLYGWKPSLSLGRFQDTAHIRREALEEHGVSCVRRMTGGGALIHGGDLSYSLVFPRNYLAGKGVKESYRHLCRFLLRLYEKLGLEAWFTADAGLEAAPSPICLAANEPYDIVIDGKKMGGNAQRYTKRTLLMHGSIPMHFDRDRFAPLFGCDSGLDRAACLESLKISIEYEELAGLVTDSFSQTFEVHLESDSLSRDETERMHELERRKYADENWTWHGESKA